MLGILVRKTREFIFENNICNYSNRAKKLFALRNNVCWYWNRSSSEKSPSVSTSVLWFKNGNFCTEQLFGWWTSGKYYQILNCLHLFKYFDDINCNSQEKAKVLHYTSQLKKNPECFRFFLICTTPFYWINNCNF